MPNPLLIAAKGKGFLPMITRGRVIANRYGLTPGKMDAALSALTATLARFASPATLPITASALKSNPSAAIKYAHQGLELAIHGLQHVDYSLLSLAHQLDHFRQAREIFKRLEIPLAGFRCPYLRWNADTLTALQAAGFIYDSSQALAWDVVGEFSTGAYHRALDFYRAQTIQQVPSLPGWSDELIRIPYSLPDDEALVDRLQITDPDLMAGIWLAMLDRAYNTGELFTLGLHPERAIICQPALLAVLVKARSLSPAVWIARLDEIAAWFRNLGSAAFTMRLQPDGLYHITITAPDRATILVRSSEIQSASLPWVSNFQVVSAREFAFRSDKRPVVGLAPDSPFSLQRFLRHQGYLVETGAESQAYAVFLDRYSFDTQDERPLLAELERVDQPLVRLSRWPESARCALSITGDVDAFTIWDYARRILEH